MQCSAVQWLAGGRAKICGLASLLARKGSETCPLVNNLCLAATGSMLEICSVRLAIVCA